MGEPRLDYFFKECEKKRKGEMVADKKTDREKKRFKTRMRAVVRLLRRLEEMDPSSFWIAAPFFQLLRPKTFPPVIRLGKSSLLYIHNRSKIQPLLTSSSAVSLGPAVVGLDYTGCFFTGLSTSVQASSVFPQCSGQRDPFKCSSFPVTSLLGTIQWLPISLKVKLQTLVWA